MQTTYNHIVDPIKPSAEYNVRLTNETDESTPAGRQNAAIPIDPCTNIIVSQKDGVNYFSGIALETPNAALDVINSEAGHEATRHAVYVETHAQARRLFAGLLETPGVLNTIVDIYYLDESGFTAFSAAEQSSSRPLWRIIELLIERYSVPTEQAAASSETAPETDRDSAAEIPKDELYGYISCWVANTTTAGPPSNNSISQALDQVRGIEDVRKPVRKGQNPCYRRLDGRVWDIS